MIFCEGLKNMLLHAKTTPIGVGIDMVTISELRELSKRTRNAFVMRTFTERERREAELLAEEPYTYYAGRFAVKEAAFKALAPLSKTETFDFRIIETLKKADGSPYIHINHAVHQILLGAGIDQLLTSISTEGDCAVAIVIASKKPK